MRDSSTRSFNTSPMGRGGYDRNRRRRQRNILTVAIVLVMAAIVVLSVMLIMEVTDCGKKPDAGIVNKDSKFADITFEDKLHSSADLHKGELILVNASFPYVFAETPTLSDVYANRGPYGLAGSKGYLLEAGTLAALNLMATDFKAATGESYLYIRNSDCYRDAAKQDSLHADAPEKYGVSGTSEHHTGTCLDFKVYKDGVFYDMDSATLPGVENYKWVYNNAYKYGFILRFPTAKSGVTGVDNEPYHFRHVGYAHAYYMHTYNLCLEEYLDFIRDNHGKSSPLYFDGDNGTSYMIYYVAASTDSLTSIPVPAEGSAGVKYTVSGDNKAGFIVTVEKKNG